MLLSILRLVQRKDKARSTPPLRRRIRKLTGPQARFGLAEGLGNLRLGRYHTVFATLLLRLVRDGFGEGE